METYKQTTPVVSMVLLLRHDPAPEWPVYYCSDTAHPFREGNILSMFTYTAGIRLPLKL